MRADLDRDLLDQNEPARRFGAMAELRAHEPIHQIGGAGGPWYLARRSAVEQVLPEVLVFGGGMGSGDDTHVDDQAMNGILEPRHGQVRKVVNGLVAAHKARKVAPFLESLCTQRLDALAERARRGENLDLMADYLDHVPSSAIAWLLGWPIEDAIQLYRWTVEVCERGMEMAPGRGGSLKTIHPVFAAYVEAKIEARAAIPEADWPDDGLTKLLTAEVEGARLSPAAVRTQLMFLLGAGSETTRDMLGGFVYELARDPALLARLRDDRELIGNGCEEALRIYSPTQFMVRNCMAPIEVDGHAFAPGDVLYFGLASANRDERHFGPDAEHYRVDRENASDHLALGAGPHVCLGAFLLRLETRIAINALLDRFDRLELVEGPDFEPLPMPMFYGPARLPVRAGCA